MRTLAKSPRRVGALAIDPGRLEARFAGARLELSRLEFALLCRLASEPLRVFTKGELLREVWGYEAYAPTRTLDAHACRLRRKLEHAGAHGHVVNRRGVGYRLVDGTPASVPASETEGEVQGGDPAAVALRRVAAAA